MTKLNSNRLNIAKAIIELKSLSPNGKVKVIDIAEKAGIARQNIYANHKDLVSVAQGKSEMPAELMQFIQETSNVELDSAGLKIKQQYDELKSSIEEERAEFKKSTFTYLMKNDLALHDAKKNQHQHVKTQSQLSDKIADNKRLEQAYGKAKARIIELEHIVDNLESSAGGKVVREIIEPDLMVAFDTYNRSNDLKDYIATMKFALSQAVNNTIRKAEEISATSVYVFINTHNASLENYVKTHVVAKGSYVYMSLPCYTRKDRKIYIERLLSLDIPIHAIVPETTEQNKIWYRNTYHILKIVPENILAIFDHKFQPPVINEGLDSIIITKIKSIV